MVRHDPTFLSARGRRWATCTCGWKSPIGTATFIQIAFGQHFAEASR